MNKVEKYHQYVIEDLVKKTNIDYDKKILHFPSLPSSFLSLLFYNSPSPPTFFSSYVESMYALKGDEIKIIWEQYWDRVSLVVS